MIQARAVGNAVYVEEEGMAGNYCVFGLSDGRAAGDVAEGINKALRDAVGAEEEETDAMAAALGEAEAEAEQLRKQLAGCKCKKKGGLKAADLNKMTDK